jgi:hypothetical protein
MADRGMYHGAENTPGARYIEFKYFMDGANPPTSPGNPQNLFITSFTRISQGLFRLTLADGYKLHCGTSCELNVNVGGTQRWAQPGPVVNIGNGLPMTVDIFIVDNSSAVQDPPAANANNFISGTVIVCDSGSV